MTYSSTSHVNNGENNLAYVYINGIWDSNSPFLSYSMSGESAFTGGRQITREVSAGDHIELRTTEYMGGEYSGTLFCVEYLPKM